MKESFFPAGLFLFTLFAFGPFTVYYGNPGELDAGYFSVLCVYILPATTVAIILLMAAGTLIQVAESGARPES